MSSESRFWNNFGKFSAVVGTIAAVVAILAAFNRSGGEDVHLYIESAPYKLTPKLQKLIENRRSFARSIVLREEVTSSLPGDLDSETKINVLKVVEDLYEQSWEIFDAVDFNNYRGISFLELENTGTVAATELIVDIPDDGMAQVILADGTEVINQFKNALKVGDLRAGNTVDAIVWTTSPLSTYDLEAINVTHKTGKGTVSWPVTTNRFGRFFGEYPYFVPLIVYILLMIGGYFGSLTKESADQKNESKEQASEAEDA